MRYVLVTTVAVGNQYVLKILSMYL